MLALTFSPTTVASARGRRGDDPDLDPNWVYVGRAIPYRAWAGSVWSNPFWHGRAGFGYDRRRVDPAWLRHAISGSRALPLLELYALWLDTQPALLARLHELTGKTLICWCGVWRPGDPPIGCHAQVLAERVNDLMDTRREGEPPCLL